VIRKEFAWLQRLITGLSGHLLLAAKVRAGGKHDGAMEHRSCV